MIRQLRTFSWVVQASAELLNLPSLLLSGFLWRLQTRCRCHLYWTWNPPHLLRNALGSHADRNAVKAATTLYSRVTVEMNFQAARFLTKLLLPLWLSFLTYLVIFISQLTRLSLKNFSKFEKFSVLYHWTEEPPLSFKWRLRVACIPFRDRFLLVYTLHGGVKLLEYFIQLLRKNHLQVFLKTIFVTPLLKYSHPFAYLRFLPLVLIP